MSKVEQPACAQRLIAQGVVGLRSESLPRQAPFFTFDIDIEESFRMLRFTI